MAEQPDIKKPHLRTSKCHRHILVTYYSSRKIHCFEKDFQQDILNNGTLFLWICL